MKRETNAILLTERLFAFLHEAGWTEVRQARGLRFYSPPESLGIKGKYTIALPDDPSRPSVSSFIYQAADSLVQIYGYGQIGDLLSRSASLSNLDRSTRIISRFVDKSTYSGAIPLVAISSYVKSIEAALYRGAKYLLGSEFQSADIIAKQFAKECLFLQTSVGSFVAKVEIPQTVLRQKDLFGDTELDSAQVTLSLFSAIQFINERILGSDVRFEDEETLSDAISLFDVELLNALSDVLLGSEMESIEFSFELGNRIQMTSTGWISPERRERLKSFVAFINEQLRGENSIEIVGSIVELRSRDPEGDSNHIRVVADFYGDRVFFTATLTNSQYQQALEAHKNKRQVKLVGRGIRLKTQIRVLELKEFT